MPHYTIGTDSIVGMDNKRLAPVGQASPPTKGVTMGLDVRDTCREGRVETSMRSNGCAKRPGTRKVVPR
jgi:hypothetical protein